MTKPSRIPEVRRAKHAWKNTLTISLDTSALDDLLDEFGSNVGDAVRAAAQAGAQVLYDEVLSNVSRIGEKTGNLQSAIYQAFSSDNSGPRKATYHIGWNSKIAPHAGLIEHGHVQRYVTFVGKDGKWHTAVRPSMKGRTAPKRYASQSRKDAYYVPLAGGPKQIAAKPFLRPAQAKFAQAFEAAKEELIKRLEATNEP